MLYINKIFLDYSPIESGNITSNDTPVISWSLSSDAKGDRQMSYRAVLSTDDGEFFDTGIVATDEQSFVYNGESLPRGEMIFIDLTVESANGDTATKDDVIYSGVVDFNAPWITMQGDTQRRVLRFSKKIKPRRSVKFATLYVCGLGYNTVLIDGVPVTDSVLDPVHSDYSQVCYYNVITDLHEYFESGRCPVFEFETAPGWRNTDSEHVKLNTQRPISFEGKTQLAAILHLKYTNGTEEKIVTGTDWTVSYSNTVEANIFDGTTYDAGIYDYEETNAVICDAPGGVMLPMTVQPIKANKIYTPVSMFRADDDTYVFDFGQNIAGVCMLPLYYGIKKGQCIKMKYAEVLDDETGKIYDLPLRGAKATDTYIASGEETFDDAWIPEHTYHGFRYMQLEGYGKYPEKELFRAAAIYSDVDNSSDFECGNPLVNRIHKNAVQTERANIHGILTDCPQRDERMAWLNDATVRFELTPYNFDMGRMFPKIVRDIYESQKIFGAVTCTVPYVFGSNPADPVCSSYLIAAYQSYLHYNNTGIIDECFDGFEKWEKCLLDKSDDYIVNYSYYGDWASPVYACRGDEDAGSSVTPGVLMSTGYSYYNCKLLSEFARLTGRKDKVGYYDEISEKIKKSFNEKWVDAETGKVSTGSQGAHAFALWLDILPDHVKEKTAKLMKDDLEGDNYRITTGNLTTRYLLEMLAKYGYTDVAWKLLNRIEYPSIGFEINNEATTVWERWELKKNPNMNSHNHPMYGAVDYFMHAYLAGVRPIDGGFKRVFIKPYMPSELLSCRDTVTTPYGDIEVKWVKRYGKKCLYITVPFGVTADVEFEGQSKTVEYGSYLFTHEG